jgi:DNA polymerase III subunit beta
MKLTVDRTDLANALKYLGGSVSNKNTLPVLGTIRLETEGAALRLRTTNLDLELGANVGANVQKHGGICLPFDKLNRIAGAMAGAEMEIEVGDRPTASIRGGTSHFKLLGYALEDFPPSMHQPATTKLPASNLRMQLARTAFAVSTDETRYVLNGVSLELNGHLRVVATDGRRLSFDECELSTSVPATNLILPRLAAQVLAKHLPDDGSVGVWAEEGKNRVSFDLGDRTLTSKVIEGVFPNYRQVMPTEHLFRIVLPREALLRMVAQAKAVVSDDAKESLKIQIDTGEKRLSLALHGSEGQSYAGHVEGAAEGPKGKAQSDGVCLGADYFHELLRNLTSELVAVQVTDGLSPVVFTIPETKFKHVLMPRRGA